ncbi:phytanoyl-CoA dioxygenase family protein [Candidatus Pelagibacter sp.]|nr:phytanoyl-CoA dioxygenase family protein [Candidatus Pelagibacter sp.]
MKEYVISVLKKLKIFKLTRNIYKILFKKTYLYQKFQRMFTDHKVRLIFSKIEKKIISFLYFRSKKIFLERVNKSNDLYIQLKDYGNTNSFTISALENNKDEIVKYFINNKIFNDKEPNNKFYLQNRNQDLEVGYYDIQTTANCPHIFDIVNDDKLIETLSTYFNGPYKLDYMSTWWSFKNLKENPKEKTQYFHRDIDNFNFVKLFIYLTDVDDLNGAHQYIRFSHTKKIENTISTKTVSFDMIKKNIKDKDVYSFVGKSGSAVLENTYGLHRGSTPKSKDRLMLSMTFSLIKTPYSPVKPFMSRLIDKSAESKINNIINQNYFL